jgi:hypothetical protein
VALLKKFFLAVLGAIAFVAALSFAFALIAEHGPIVDPPDDPSAGKISAATLACERHAKAKATNPSSVDFSLLLDRSGKVQPDGTVTIFSTFTARNAFNAEQKFKIYCLVAGDQIRDSEILPAE